MIQRIHSSICFLFLVAAVTVRTSPIAWAQDNSPAPPPARQDLSYADQREQKNVLVLDFYTGSAYDDNVFSDNQDRVADIEFHEAAHIGLVQTSRHFDLHLDYRPDMLFYRNVVGYNQLNQNLQFDGTLWVARHFGVRATELFNDQTGLFSPSSNQDLSLPLAEPSSSLNSTGFIPLVHELANQAYVHIVYQESLRSTFDVFGGYETERFRDPSNASLDLLDTSGTTGGLEYSYRTSQLSTFGIRYLHQNLSFGSLQQVTIESGFISFVTDLSPAVSISMFGGPQFARTRGSSILVPTQPSPSESMIALPEWNGGGGVTVTFRSDQTVFVLNAQRLVTDGGGLMASAINSYGGFNIRRRLSSNWDVVLSGGYAQSTALPAELGTGILRSQSAGLSLERRISDRLTAQFGYTYARQRAAGLIPFAADLNRNLIAVGLVYRHDEIPLGR